MNKKGLTITIVFNAGSLNYGEGIGNISELKKLSRGNGAVHTVLSRQAIRYDFARLGNEFFGWNLDTVAKNGTIQFKEECSIVESEEMDLFGYMKTTKEKASDVRSCAVGISNAISLEPYHSDMDFLNNKGMADRIKDKDPKIKNDLANIEQHYSYYAYTVTIDLKKVGVDQKITLNKEIRAKRVKELLEVIKLLNRHIRGRIENLAPVFVIGGIYDIPNPYFMGRVTLNEKADAIQTSALKSVLETSFMGKCIQEDTYIGLLEGVFSNSNEIKALLDNDHILSVNKFFELLEGKIDKVYGEL